MKYTAFISHSNKDVKALHAIRQYLEDRGIPCFASERDLRHNANWQTQLVEAMDSSEMLIYVHSKNSNVSAEVSREINYFADKCHRPILVYRLDDVAYNIDRAYYLQSINYIDSLDKPEDGLDQLVQNVRHTLDGTSVEWESRSSGKKRRIRRIAFSALGLLVIAGGLIGFHAFEKGKATQMQAESAAILARTENWLSREDSLEFVLPGVDEAEALMKRCAQLHTVSAPEGPDFQKIRDEYRQDLLEIHTRRVNTVKALYEPLKYASPENRISTEEAIRENVQAIHQLDEILDIPADEEIEMIMTRLNTTE